MWLLWAPIHHCKSLCAAPSLSPPSCRQPAPDWVHTWAPSAELLGLSSLRLSWRAAWIRPAAGLGTRPNTGRALPSSPRAPWNGRRACWLCTALGPGTPKTGTARGSPPGDSGSACPRRPGVLLGLEPSQQLGLQRSGELGGRARHLPGSLQSSKRREAATPHGMMCVRSRSVPGGHQRRHKKTPWEGRSGQISDPARWSQPPTGPSNQGTCGDGRHLGLSRLGASSSGWSLGDANTRQHTRRPTQQTVPGGIPL